MEPEIVVDSYTKKLQLFKKSINDRISEYINKQNANMSNTEKFRSIDDCDTTDENESEELFSDDEQKKEIKCRSNVSSNASVQFRSETPLSLIDYSNAVTPSDANIPSAPLSLVPFLNKINEQWTSDLETPQADKSLHLCTRPSTSATKNVEDTPKFQQHTPDITAGKNIDNKITSNSPVIVSRKVRKRPKRRRIFTTSISIDTSSAISNENITVDVGALPNSENNNIVAQDNTIDVISASQISIDNTCGNHESQVLNRIQDVDNNEKLKKSGNAVPAVLDSSTQEFFKNASFSNIDEICFENDKQTINALHVFNLNTIKENKNIGFFTGYGAPINVSEEELFKAETLLADEMQIQNYELSGEKNSKQNNKDLSSFSVASNSIKQKNRALSSFSIQDNTIINISENLLVKTDIFEKRLNSSVETVTSNTYKKEDKRQVKVSNIGFQTTHGACFNAHTLLQKRKLIADEDTSLNRISASELKKARFSDEFEVTKLLCDNPNIDIGNDEKIESEDVTNRMLIDNNAEDNNTCNNNQFDINTSNIGFRTARGTNIDISKQALSKAKILFAEELNKPIDSSVVKEINVHKKEDKGQEVKIPNIGFRTARGTNIDISKQALSKAKILLAEELNKPIDSSVVKQINVHKKEDKGQEVKIPNIGFRTARGINIDISQQALSKAKILFAEELNKPIDSSVVKEINVHKKEDKGQEVKIPNIGFRTARGINIDISQQALSKAKILLAEELNKPIDSSVVKEINVHKKEDKGQEVKIPNIAFQTAAHSVSIDAHTSLQKRKFTKLLCDNPNIDLGNDDKIKSEQVNVTNRMLIDDDAEDNNRRIEASCAAELSNKVAVSAVEVNLSEEKQSDVVANSILDSPRRNTSESPELNVVGSPVIGRHSMLRKCNSLGYQKEHDVSRIDQIIMNNASIIAPPENFVRNNVSCEKTNENKLNVKSQRLMQVEKQRAESNSAESVEYGDSQMLMDFIDESAQILQDRLAAALEQEKIITSKRKSGSKQLVGHLYRYKQINSNARLSLRDISDGVPPLPRSYQELINQRIPPNILSITAATAASYKFRCSDFYGNDVARSNIHGIEMEDGARLIMDENGYVGIREFFRAFLASPGVDPRLLPVRWIENHYRWIVWKLASMDRMKFDSAELPRALTPSHVMAQLKYRYDREIDRYQRPAIRRILEKDDVASKRMVLCVSSIVENNNIVTETEKNPRVGLSKWKIELTDGWYSIPACIDIDMMKNISNGKVREGTKLVMSGAELLNCDEGCHPLEALADACLKLHTNSTRRARWDSKLGYASCPGPIPIRLRDVCPSGGIIGKMTITVARVYPMLYYEKTTSGESIIRNAKCEEKVQIEYEQRRRSKAEAFYAKAEKDFQENLSYETDNIDMCATRSSRDCERLSTQEFISKKHDDLLNELRLKAERFKQELESNLRKSLPEPRQVSPLLKVRVCDGNVNAILSVWTPSEEIIDALKEGACVSLRNIVASGKRGCELQLTARRSAIFTSETMRDMSYPFRVCTSLCEIGNSEFVPLYGEFDTVGFVCSIGDAPYGMKDFEVVHLAYPKTDSNNSSYLSILFWQRIASFGYTDILTVGSIVACHNLEWRRTSSWNLPVAYCTDRSAFTRNPRRNHLYESFENLQNLITDPSTYIEKCTSELSIELQKRPGTRTPTRYTPVKNTPGKTYNSLFNFDKKLVDYRSPLSTQRFGTVNSKNFVTPNSSIQKRLDKLQYYDDPPELSPITIKSSKRTSLDFRPIVFTTDANSLKDTLSTNKPGSSNQSVAEKQ